MPVYGFKCKECGESFTLFLSISKKDEAQCPRCKSRELAEDFSGYGSSTGRSQESSSKFT